MSRTQADLIVVPTSIEAALEALAICELLDRRGVTTAIGTSDRLLGSIWPVTLGDVQRIPLVDAEVPDQRFLVISPDEKVAGSLARRVGKDRVLFRTAGIEPMRVDVLNGARRYRRYHVLLLRTALEVAELGDRPHELVPSLVAAGAAASSARDRAGALVFVPDRLRSWPALEAWLTTALTRASAIDHVELAGGPRVAKRLADFRVRDLDLEAAASVRRVVLPMCDEVSLVEALGAEAVIFDPAIPAHAWSKAWIEAHTVTHTADELTLALEQQANEDTDRRRWLRSLASLARPGPAPAVDEVIARAIGLS